MDSVNWMSTKAILKSKCLYPIGSILRMNISRPPRRSYMVCDRVFRKKMRRYVDIVYRPVIGWVEECILQRVNPFLRQRIENLMNRFEGSTFSSGNRLELQCGSKQYIEIWMRNALLGSHQRGCPFQDRCCNSCCEDFLRAQIASFA